MKKLKEIEDQTEKLNLNFKKSMKDFCLTGKEYIVFEKQFNDKKDNCLENAKEITYYQKKKWN